MKFWVYSKPYVPRVFSYDGSGNSEEHGESNRAFDFEVLEGETGGEGQSDIDDDIMDKDLNIDKAEFVDAPDVQFSTGELTNMR